MKFQILTLLLLIILSGLLTGLAVSAFYGRKLERLKEENFTLKSQNSFNDNLLNELKLEFAKIAKDAVSSQQEALILQHGTDLKAKMELFKAEEITPVNTLLKEFKVTIDEYKKSHTQDTVEVKNAVAAAEKYAKALTSDQISRGAAGEDLLERILNFANFEENIHYSKQVSTGSGKPDFVIHLAGDRHIVIDSKAILKNYINYRQTEDEVFKKEFINDITACINNLAKRHYEDIETLNQPGFILMYIPIEPCVNLIYTDKDFEKVIELANTKNIIITGTSSLLVSLRLINKLMISEIQNRNVQKIITAGERLYNNIAVHAQGLFNIRQALEKASETVQKEINRFTARNKGSIFKEAEILKQYGIKNQNSSGSGAAVPEEFSGGEILTEGNIND